MARAIAFFLCLLIAAPAWSAERPVDESWEPSEGPWAYSVEWDYVRMKRGKARKRKGQALLWLPPEVAQIRGLLLIGKLGIDTDLAFHPAVRQVCREERLGIAYFHGGLSGVFHFWKDDKVTKTVLTQLDRLAEKSGHPEVARVPWITVGHSTSGIYCRNVAYWQPKRVAGVLHIKSGNFHQDEHRPPKEYTLTGVPMLCINGHLETFGPHTGIDPEWGRETQWVYVRKDIFKFKEQDPQHLMAVAPHPGADHFHGSPRLYALGALFFKKTAQYRLPQEVPAGDGPVHVKPMRLEDGVLTDPDLHNPQHEPAPYDQYTGDRQKAFWHYDMEMAKAVLDFHRNLTHHQVLTNPTIKWLDQDDGWVFQASSEWLDTMPEKYGGKLGGKQVGHADGPIQYLLGFREPAERVGPDTFRLYRHTKKINVAAFHPGDEHYRSTIRWGGGDVPKVKKGAGNEITFPEVETISAGDLPYDLKASASSGLPISFLVEYGPVKVEDGKLMLHEVPTNPQYPFECKVSAFQIGRRTAPQVNTAKPVTRIIKITAP